SAPPEPSISLTAMAKRPPRPTGTSASSTGTMTADSEVPVVGGREPCPCGSGRRYKACHGRESAHAAQQLVTRPFEGLPGEVDWVMMREIVPAATARVTLAGDAAGPYAGREVVVATVLPLAWPA